MKKNVRLENEYGCSLEGLMTEEEINGLKAKGWKVTEPKLED